MLVLELYYYNKKVSNAIIDVSSTKLEEVSNIYIKKNIIPTSFQLSDLLIINKNKNDEILYVEMDTEKANEIMIDVVTKIQDSIDELLFEDNLLKKYNDNVYIKIPLLLNSGSLTSSLGPKVPIKIEFYEQVLANIDTEIVNYGINNALIKVYLTIDLEQKIYVPFKSEKFNRSYKLLLSSKIINGTVPDVLGGSITNHETLNS
jgi:sporulation protein YunB